MFFTSQAWPEACPDSQNFIGQLMVNRLLTSRQGCLIQVTPIAKPGLIYREYVFDQRGNFLIFDSVAGPAETSTAYRSFFLFPRRQIPTFQILDKSVVIIATSGDQIRIDADSLRVQDFSSGPYQIGFRQGNSVSIAPEAAAEITNYRGLLLDSGWRLGSAPQLEAAGRSNFIDASGNTCELENREIFSYESATYGEPPLRFPTDGHLWQFLKERCPQLHTESLKPAQPSELRRPPAES